jgi:serine/threonine protein kinase
MVFSTDIRLGELIAKGGMAGVYSVEAVSRTKMMEWKSKHKLNKASDLVVKLINEDSNCDANQFKFEVAVMDAMRNFTRHTVGVVGWSINPYAIVMKRYQTSLDNIIFQNERIRLVTIASIIKDINDALTACEKLGIIHNDLKPSKYFTLS